MNSFDSKELSSLLVKHILGGQAFIKIEEILERINYQQVGIKFGGLPYSFWQILEHMRIAQRDILEFSESSNYKAMKWPDEYWPENSAPKSVEDWEKTKSEFFKDRDKFNTLLAGKSENLLTPLEWGEGQNLFREALLIIEHNAYHTGQLMIINRLLDEDEG